MDNECCDIGWNGSVKVLLRETKGGIVICTKNVAHTMVEGTVRMAQANGIPIVRTHSNSVSAMKECMKKMSN